VSIFPVADTTLIETAPDANLGGAPFFNAGTTSTGPRNRALLRFDPASHLPAESQILSVTLTLEVVRQPSGGGTPSNFGLFRVLRAWGEGTQVPEAPNSPGLGSPAAPGESTWQHRFAPDAAWAEPGGAPGVDYAASSSSEALVYGTDRTPYVFESTPQLVSDVQGWLDGSTPNHGWMLISDAEGEPRTARSFASREDAFLAPRLLVEFQAVPEPTCVSLGAVGLALVWALRRRR
jgi:uncharacterized protein (TIGR03382 family)